MNGMKLKSQFIPKKSGCIFAKERFGGFTPLEAAIAGI